MFQDVFTIITDDSDMPQLLQAVVDVVHWQFLGLELGIVYPKLEIIQKHYHDDIMQCKAEMLYTWLKGSYIAHMMFVPSWSTLKTALKNIGENALAATIPNDGELIITCLCLYLHKRSCVLPIYIYVH